MYTTYIAYGAPRTLSTQRLGYCVQYTLYSVWVGEKRHCRPCVPIVVGTKFEIYTLYTLYSTPNTPYIVRPIHPLYIVWVDDNLFAIVA